MPFISVFEIADPIPLRVMTDKTRIEHNESAFGLIATKKSCDKGY